MKMKKYILLPIFLVCCAMAGAQPSISDADTQRATGLVSKMTLQEKCLLITGQKDKFHTAAIERLGIPSVRMADGPQGVRNKTRSTYYPCGLSVAASWNREVADGVGKGIGTDARERSVGIMLCPGVNIYRSPLCGRNFEYMGEDPFLAGETALHYIAGMQREGTMATIKHFAGNNAEYARRLANSMIDERTLNEIYFPVFRKAVEKGRVGAVMTSYNPINGVHAAENPWLIKENLRAWGHKGIVMSDWGSTYPTMAALTSGLDLEMPQATSFKYDSIRRMIENGVVSMKEIDDKCIHILQTFSAYGFLDKPLKEVADNAPVPVNRVSRESAYKAALEGPVLLKNDGILPVRKGRIVVIGPNADNIPFGGGSGSMYPIEGTTTTLYEGLKAKGEYNVTLLADSSDREAVAGADVVIFAAGFNHYSEKEGQDRTYWLPDNQDDAILELCSINPNVVVVVNSGGEIDTEKWLPKVRGLMMAWYGGQEGGKALAALITGEVSPSGRLPFTFWGSMSRNPSTASYYPEASMRKDYGYDTQYLEGIFLGYRASGRVSYKPLFPFGYGLTYSSFSYSDLKVVPAGDGFDVSFTVRNTGKADAAEVAQVYVAPESPSVIRPAHELKGYEKVYLAKGKSGRITVHLDADAFARYDMDNHSWTVDKGAYRIQVAASAEDIRLEGVVSRD